MLKHTRTTLLTFMWHSHIKCSQAYIQNKCRIALFVNYSTLDNHYGVYSLGFIKINIFYDIKHLQSNKSSSTFCTGT